MGKSNRIRNARANATLAGVKPPKKKQGMPSWALNLITIAVAAVILISVAAGLLISNGTFSRMQTAMKSDNFRVDKNMMNYYFQTQYQNFVSENSSYLSYYGLDTSLSLKEQYVDTSDESQGTWFDYMMTQTESQVKEILIYCEEAKTRDIELTDEELDAIDAELAMYETYAKMYGYTTNSYIATMYGEGMKLKDVKNAIKLSTLASKCAEEVGTELEGAITDTEINEEYAANKLDYDLVDYTHYTFDVSYKDAIIEVLGEDYDEDDAETEENVTKILAKYKDLIAKAKADAKALAAITDADKFKAAIYNNIAEKAYDDAYEATMEDSEVASDKLPGEDTLSSIRTKAIAYIVDILTNDKDYEAVTKTEEEVTKAFDIEITKEFATDLETAVSDAAETAKTEKDTYIVKGASYNEDEEASEWMFESGRAVGNIKTFEEGDGANDEELASDVDDLESSFSASAYYVDKTAYRDEALTRDLGLMVFSTEAAAKEAIALLSAGVTIEQFEEICNDNGGTFTNYENYTKGSMGVSAFDTWLYGDDVTVGTYTTTAITLEANTSYAVALYYGDGDAEWYVTVKSAIFTENYEAFTAEITEKYTVEIKENVINRIDG